MALERVEGLVVGANRFGESSAMLSFFTERHGRLTLVAKGLYRPASRLASPLQFLTRAEATLYMRQGRNAHPVREATLLESFASHSRDLARFTVASRVAVAVAAVTAEEEPVPGLYEDTLSALRALEEGPGLVFEAWLLRALTRLGMKPVLHRCARCPERRTNGLGHEGTVCAACARPTDLTLDDAETAALRALSTVTAREASRLPNSPRLTRLCAFLFEGNTEYAP